MKTIGVLGGTGAIGSRTVKLLEGKYALRVSYLNKERPSTKDITYVRVDASKEEDIRAFLEGLDAVVNCAGASYKNGARISRIAAEAGVPYIDPSGEAFLEKDLETLQREHIFVLSCGYFPGMTGLLMRDICNSFTEPTEISGYSVSEEIPSFSAIEDFILTNLSGFGVTGSYYEKGEILRDETPVIEIIQNRPYELTNYLSVEAERIGREYHLQRAHWYNASFGDEIVRKMQEIIIQIRGGDPKYKDTIAEVPKLFAKKLEEMESYTYIHVEGKGYRDGMFYSQTRSVKCGCSSELSALIAASTAEYVLSHEMKPGIYYAMDLLDAAEILPRIEAVGGEYRHRENVELSVIAREEDSFAEFEEGVI